MILVSGEVEIRPEHRDEAVDLARWMMAETARETGCLTYRFYADLENPDRIRVFELWESQSALDAHIASEHMAEFNRRLPEMLAAAPDIRRYEIDDGERLV